MAIKSWMSLIIDIIGPEYPELYANELGKIAEFDFVYTLASANKLAPNLTKICIINRS